MKTLTVNDFVNDGINIINDLDAFDVNYSAYSKDYEKYNPMIISKNFIEKYSNLKGRDFECLIVRYVKKTQDEINAEDLEYQIKQLENKFNVNIRHTPRCVFEN